MISHEFLNDPAILKYIDELQLKTQYIKIVILDKNEVPLRAIEGRATGGSVNINSNSAVRRTCNLSLVTEYNKKEQDPLNIMHEVTNIKTLISINKRVVIEVGIQNSGNKYKNYNIFWFPLGVFIIQKPQVTYDMNGISISLSLTDKMALLNGQSGGTFTAPTVFSPIELEDGTEEVVTFEAILDSLLQLWLGTNKVKYQLEIPATIRTGVRWNGQNANIKQLSVDDTVFFKIADWDQLRDNVYTNPTSLNLFIHEYIATKYPYVPYQYLITFDDSFDSDNRYIIVDANYASAIYQNLYDYNKIPYDLPLPKQIYWDVDIDTNKILDLKLYQNKWWYTTGDGKKGSASGLCVFEYSCSWIDELAVYRWQIDAGLFLAAETENSTLISNYPALDEQYKTKQLKTSSRIIQGRISSVASMLPKALKKGVSYTLDGTISITNSLLDSTFEYTGSIYMTVLDRSGKLETTIGTTAAGQYNLMIYQNVDGVYTAQPVSTDYNVIESLSSSQLADYQWAQPISSWFTAPSSYDYAPIMHSGATGFNVLMKQDMLKRQKPRFLFSGVGCHGTWSYNIASNGIEVQYGADENKKQLVQSLKEYDNIICIAKDGSTAIRGYITTRTFNENSCIYTIKNIGGALHYYKEYDIYQGTDFVCLSSLSQLQIMSIPVLDAPLGAYFSHFPVTEDNKTDLVKQYQQYPFHWDTYLQLPTLNGSSYGNQYNIPVVKITSDQNYVIIEKEVYQLRNSQGFGTRTTWYVIIDRINHIISYYSCNWENYWYDNRQNPSPEYVLYEVLTKGELKAQETEFLLIQQYFSNANYWCYIPRNLDTVLVYGLLHYDADGNILDEKYTDADAIPAGAFENCSNIRAIAIQDDMPAFGEKAFYDSGIQFFVVPSSVKNIGSKVFAQCSSLMTITMSSSVERIYDQPFEGSDKIQAIYYGGTKEEWANVRGKVPIGGEPDSALPEIPEKIQFFAAYEPGEVCGYKEIPFVYPSASKLSAQAGDTVVTILDRIKNALGNYEYFFDTDGVFHFREIKNYLNEGSSSESLGDAINEKYFIVTNKDKTVYKFTDANLITSYNHNPNYQMIKNDFNVWGQHPDTKQPLWYHLRFMKIPANHEYRYWKYDGYKYNQYSPDPETDTLGVDYIDLKTNWRKKLYFLAQEKAPENRTAFDIELLDNLPQMYDPKSEIHDPDAAINTEGLYFFDAVDTGNLILTDTVPIKSLDVDEIGCQTHVLQNDKINCFFSSLMYNNLAYNFTNNLNASKTNIYMPLALLNNSFEEVASTDNPAYEVLRGEIHKYLSYNENITITCMPIYHLDVNQRIRVDNDESDIHGDYIIQSISLPLGIEGMMQITAQKAIERI